MIYKYIRLRKGFILCRIISQIRIWSVEETRNGGVHHTGISKVFKSKVADIWAMEKLAIPLEGLSINGI